MKIRSVWVDGVFLIWFCFDFVCLGIDVNALDLVSIWHIVVLKGFGEFARKWVWIVGFCGCIVRLNQRVGNCTRTIAFTRVFFVKNQHLSPVFAASMPPSTPRKSSFRSKSVRNKTLQTHVSVLMYRPALFWFFKAVEGSGRTRILNFRQHSSRLSCHCSRDKSQWVGLA